MKNPLKTLKTAFAVAFLACGLMGSASAVPITGSIGFNGSGTGTQAGGTSTLTFNNPMTVDIRLGDYLPVPSGTTTTFVPISWTGSGNSAVLTSVNSPEWTLTFGGTTYSFNLLSLTNASMSGGAVSLAGQGVAFISGAINRDPTFATFSVQGTGDSFTFTIVQSSTSANGRGVPEGGSALALLGLSFVIIEGLRRKLVAA